MALLIAAIIFISAFQQSLSGFGFSLVAMPILVQLVGIQVAAPLVAVLALTINIINGIRWRADLDFHEIKRLGIWMALGVPLGIWGIFVMNETIVKVGLGALLVAYALFALLRPEKLPVISRRWAYPAGFFAGLLGGAYNTSGPPLILYGSLRDWSHQRFRAVLQSLFGFAATIVVTGHIITGHYTQPVLKLAAYSVPGLLLAVLLGALLDQHIKPEHLKKWITIATLVLGVSLLIPR
jgi:uncharacterized membrane protein YfcA